MVRRGSTFEVANFLLLICTSLILWNGVSCRDSFNGGRKALEYVSSSSSQNDIDEVFSTRSFVCRIIHLEGDMKYCYGALVSSRWMLTTASCAPNDLMLSRNNVRVVCGSPSSAPAFTQNELDVIEVKPLGSAITGTGQEPDIALLILNTDATGPFVKFEESDGPDFYILEQNEVMKDFFNEADLEKMQTQDSWQNANIGLPLVMKSSAMRNGEASDNSSSQITACCLATGCQSFIDGIKRCTFSRVTPLEHKSICLATGICNEVPLDSSTTPSFRRSLSSSSPMVDACPDLLKSPPITWRSPIPPYLPPLCSNKTIKQSTDETERLEALTPVIVADNAPVLRTLIKCLQFNVNSTDSDNNTLLHITADKNASKSAKVLCDLGIGIELNNTANKTALIVAAEQKSLAALMVILSCGANVNATDENRKTALYYAAMKNASRIAHVLCHAGIDTEIKKQGGRTALLAAAYQRKLESLKVIVNSCKNVNVSAKANEGKTALHYAANDCDLEMAQFLVNHNASRTVVDKEDKTPEDLIPAPSRTCENDTISQLHGILSTASDQNEEEKEAT